MPNFDELPDDILLEIFQFFVCRKENLCSLRLVSRRLSMLVSRLLFRRLVIAMGDGTGKGAATLDESSIISAMTSGSTTIFEHTRELGICPEAFGPLPPFSLKHISNLTEFSGFWYASAPHIPLEIASLLTRCPNLTRLRLTNACFRKLTWKDFFLEAGKMEKALKFQELHLVGLVVHPEDFKPYIRHFQNLKSLAITGNTSLSASTDLGAICNILLQHDIYLEDLTTDNPEDFLVLSYLSSYSGLKRLKFGTQCREEGDGSEAVNRLYTQVLPKQAEVLEELQLQFCNTGVWCEMPTANQLAGLTKCRKLKRLNVSFTFMSHNGGNARTSWEFWFGVALEFPNLEHLFVYPINPYPWLSSQRELDSWDVAKEEVTTQYQMEKKIKFTVR